MTWHIHVPGRDTKLDEVVARRFGSAHKRPCLDENISTCALFDCQQANCCQHLRRTDLKEAKP